MAPNMCTYHGEMNIYRIVVIFSSNERKNVFCRVVYDRINEIVCMNKYVLLYEKII